MVEQIIPKEFVRTESSNLALYGAALEGVVFRDNQSLRRPPYFSQSAALCSVRSEQPVTDSHRSKVLFSSFARENF